MTKRKRTAKPPEQPTAEQLDPVKHPHWFSRNMERFITPAATAALLGAGIFVVDYLVVEPELEKTNLAVEAQAKTDIQHDETIALLTQSVAQQNISLTGLGIDRAVVALKEASAIKAQLETDNRGVRVEEWTELDRQLYLGAMAQIKSAEQRLGLQERL